MGLRGKVALWLILTVVPTSFVVAIWRVNSEHREFMERRADRFTARLSERPMTRCERRPERFAVERPEFAAFAYDLDFQSRHPHAPPFPRTLRHHLQLDEPQHHWFMPGAKFLGATAIRRADSGPCAVVLVVWNVRGTPRGSMQRALIQTGALATVLTLLGLLLTVPIVRRIRRLEEAVHRARREPFSVELAGSDELSHLADAFDETFSALRSREQALEQYIANTTHDLAIPLTVLQHRLQKLASQNDGEDIRVALEESHYIAALIANMRSAAKLENPEALATTLPVELGPLVERVVGRHAPIARQKGVELDWVADDCVVLGEPTLIEQALSNLVQNAVQYNASGGHVVVILERHGAHFLLAVADDGPGIPDEMLADVLARGVRADAARSRNEDGQGFGLSIVNRVCGLHGWELDLRNDAGLRVEITGRVLE